MWASGKWQPGWVSPDYLPLFWLTGFAFAGVCWLVRRRELAAFLARSMGWVILLHATVSVIALSWGTCSHLFGSSPNDAYVVGAASCLTIGVGWVFALTWLLPQRPDLWSSELGSSVGRPSQPYSVATWLIVGLAVLVLIPIVLMQGWTLAVLGAWGLIFWGMNQAEASLPSCIATFAIVGAAAACWLLRVQSARLVSLISPLRFLFSALAVLGLVRLTYLHAPVGGMTDEALAAQLIDRVDLGERAKAVVAELRARPASRWSGIEGVLRGIREGSRRTFDQQLSRNQRGSGGDVLDFGPMKYEGSPVLVLLSVLLGRGQRSEPEAWLEDPRYEDYRSRIEQLDDY